MIGTQILLQHREYAVKNNKQCVFYRFNRENSCPRGAQQCAGHSGTKRPIGTLTWMRQFARQYHVFQNDVQLLIARMKKDDEHYTALLTCVDNDTPPNVPLEQQAWYGLFAGAAPGGSFSNDDGGGGEEVEEEDEDEDGAVEQQQQQQQQQGEGVGATGPL
jgi:hypothetical protein